MVHNNSHSRPDPDPPDPLTELARLIGQGDPFAADPRAVGRPPEAPSHAAEWHEPGFDDRTGSPAFGAVPAAENIYRPTSHYPTEPVVRYLDEGRGAAPGYASEAPYERYVEDRPPPPSYRDGPSYARMPGPNHDGPRAQSAYREEEPDQAYEEEPRRRGFMTTAAIVVGIAVIGAGGAFAYRAIFKAPTSSSPPVIRAAEVPSKIVPSTQAAESRKPFADRLGVDRSQNERVVPREEQPLDINRAIASASPVPPPPAVVAPAATVPAAGAAPAEPQATEPRKVRTVPVRPDGSMPTRPAPVTSAQPVAPAAPQPAAAKPAPARPATSNAPLSLSPQGAEPARTALPARTRTAAAVPSAPPPVATQSGYFVQISAQKSEAEAQSAFRTAQAKYPKVLGGHQLVVRRKDLGSKGIFYGAQVGPFGKDKAAQLCESLKAAGGACMIQRN